MNESSFTEGIAGVVVLEVDRQPTLVDGALVARPLQLVPHVIRRRPVVKLRIQTGKGQ